MTQNTLNGVTSSAFFIDVGVRLDLRVGCIGEIKSTIPMVEVSTHSRGFVCGVFGSFFFAVFFGSSDGGGSSLRLRVGDGDAFDGILQRKQYRRVLFHVLLTALHESFHLVKTLTCVHEFFQTRREGGSVLLDLIEHAEDEIDDFFVTVMFAMTYE